MLPSKGNNLSQVIEEVVKMNSIIEFQGKNWEKIIYETPSNTNFIHTEN